MNGREADGQVLASEQHAEARDTEGIGKKFCLAGEAKSHGLELVLADRCGDHGSGFADFEFESGVLQALRLPMISNWWFCGISVDARA